MCTKGIKDGQRSNKKVSIKKREKSKYQPKHKAVSLERLIEKGILKLSVGRQVQGICNFYILG